MDIKELRNHVIEFRDKRDWGRYLTLADLRKITS